MICSYLLWPFAILMGVEVKDAKAVAGMLGWKIFVDEVLCYRDLGNAVNSGELDVSIGRYSYVYACIDTHTCSHKHTHTHTPSPPPPATY